MRDFCSTKNKKGLFVGIIILVVSITVAVFCGLFFGLYYPKIKEKNISQPNTDKKADIVEEDVLIQWMSYIKDDTLLKDLVIAGSHDAGTIGMFFVAETQDKTVEEQLDIGTRYFDIRVTYEEEKLSIFHGELVGGDFLPVITAFREFLIAHPTETIIIDLQHFKENKEVVREFVHDFLEDLLIVNDKGISDLEFINTLTLGEMRGKCIVFWGKYDGNTFYNDYLFLRNNNDGTRPDSTLHSFYDEELCDLPSNEYISTALPYYISRYKSEGSGLFVLQGQLSLIHPKNAENGHCRNMNNYVTNIPDEDLPYINIIMRDYVEEEKNVLSLLLNLRKNNVKSEKIEVFSSLGEYIFEEKKD